MGGTIYGDLGRHSLLVVSPRLLLVRGCAFLGCGISPNHSKARPQGGFSHKNPSLPQMFTTASFAEVFLNRLLATDASVRERKFQVQQSYICKGKAVGGIIVATRSFGHFKYRYPSAELEARANLNAWVTRCGWLSILMFVNQ